MPNLSYWFMRRQCSRKTTVHTMFAYIFFVVLEVVNFFKKLRKPGQREEPHCEKEAQSIKVSGTIPYPAYLWSCHGFHNKDYNINANNWLLREVHAKIMLRKRHYSFFLFSFCVPFISIPWDVQRCIIQTIYYRFVLKSWIKISKVLKIVFIGNNLTILFLNTLFNQTVQERHWLNFNVSF